MKRKILNLLLIGFLASLVIFQGMAIAQEAAQPKKEKAEAKKDEKKQEKKTREQELQEKFLDVQQKIGDAEFLLNEGIVEIVKKAKFDLSKSDPRLLELFQKEFNELSIEHDRIKLEFQQSKKRIEEIRNSIIRKAMVEGSVLEMDKEVKMGKSGTVPQRFYELGISLGMLQGSKKYKMTKEDKEKFKKIQEELEKLKPIIREADKEGDEPLDPELFKPILELLEIK